MTVHDALRLVTQALNSTSDAPALDAQRLLLFILQPQVFPCIDTSIHETSWLFAHSEIALETSQEQLLQKLTVRRAHGEPLAYLLGTQEFYGRLFMVTPDVLIPRPATENLVEEAIAVLQKLFKEKKRSLVVADIGTGSGCIAVTLALELPPDVLAHVYAIDISEPALAVARTNAEHHQVERRITFVHGDMLVPLVNKNIDLIVSNPPYVPTKEIADSSVEKIGLQFEPRLALDGGSTGQHYIHQLRALNLPALIETTNGRIEAFHCN